MSSRLLFNQKENTYRFTPLMIEEIDLDRITGADSA
jgi:hypothetical protein